MVITVFQRRTVLIKLREVKKIITRSHEEVAELRLELRSVSFNVKFHPVICCCCSVTKLFLTLWDPMDCSMPGLPVLHYFLEFAQTHVHWIGDAIWPSRCLSPPSSFAFNLSQHQGLFQWVCSLQCFPAVEERADCADIPWARDVPSEPWGTQRPAPLTDLPSLPLHFLP